MNPLVTFSCRVYDVLLSFYPSEIRRRFGTEMSDTFAQQLSDAWEEDRLMGVLGSWSLVLPELVSIALPRQAAQPVIILPIASFLSASVISCVFVWALHHPLVLNAWYHSLLSGERH
jgi:hypothetical protein